MTGCLALLQNKFSVRFSQLNKYKAYMTASRQQADTYGVFERFLLAVKPSRVLEIGTWKGYFTGFLKKVSDGGPGFEIVSYDTQWFKEHEAFIAEGIDIKIENPFTGDYDGLKEEVSGYIQEPGITVVLCDNGNKIKEFNCVARYLKPGDYIMAHDYVDTAENFRENYYGKICLSHEISDNDIAEICIKENLETVDKQTFDAVVWVCKRKIIE
jgi:hypothetical protein